MIIVSLISMLIVTVLWMPRTCLMKWVNKQVSTFAGVLNACADHVAKDLSKQVHGYMTRIGFDFPSFAASVLAHMYSKCVNIQNAKRAFKGMPRPDLVSWTSHD